MSGGPRMAMVAWKLNGGSGPFNPHLPAGAPGRLFPLSAEAQHCLLPRLATALRPGGWLLLTAPAQRAEWRDLLTVRVSLSLGAQEYGSLLEQAPGSRWRTRRWTRAATSITPACRRYTYVYVAGH